ncbi:MAG TPA: DUF488 domain-containing protein [Thermomicrobiales bacterium]|nr:DUF488 domain-containing protein [Thermomicrobiales bacterium]
MNAIFTIGVYGFTHDTFRAALEQDRPGVFVDTRRRRGVRGSQYSFANSQRLQALLDELAIPYIHRIDLAPPEPVIRVQDAADRAAHIARHDRESLTPEFVAAYEREVLAGFDSRAFVESLPGSPGSILLFCVEGNPNACHRSLLAARLAHDLGASIEHIVP